MEDLGIAKFAVVIEIEIDKNSNYSIHQHVEDDPKCPGKI
jgi:hypothetical protein